MSKLTREQKLLIVDFYMRQSSPKSILESYSNEFGGDAEYDEMRDSISEFLEESANTLSQTVTLE